jgi:hypothetical protein
MTYELAQLNVGIIKGPMDSPVMADFAVGAMWTHCAGSSTGPTTSTSCGAERSGSSA